MYDVEEEDKGDGIQKDHEIMKEILYGGGHVQSEEENMQVGISNQDKNDNYIMSQEEEVQLDAVALENEETFLERKGSRPAKKKVQHFRRSNMADQMQEEMEKNLNELEVEEVTDSDLDAYDLSKVNGGKLTLK